MTPLDLSQKETITRRLEFIHSELADLSAYLNINYETYAGDRTARRNIERILENIANASIDIAKTLLAGEEAELPETYREAILKLGAGKLITPPVAVAGDTEVGLNRFLIRAIVFGFRAFYFFSLFFLIVRPGRSFIDVLILSFRRRRRRFNFIVPGRLELARFWPRVHLADYTFIAPLKLFIFYEVHEGWK